MGTALCEPHWKRTGAFVPAVTTVADTPMCRACFSGRPLSPLELIGAPVEGRDKKNYRHYYRSRLKPARAARRKQQGREVTLSDDCATASVAR
jgi:hypothetical protein